MNKLNIQPFLDNARFSTFHKKVLFWTAFIIIFDGYDLGIYGTVLPILMKEWNLTPVEAGSLASYALFGMMFGAFLFGTIGNRIGLKKAIITCILLFSTFTFLCGLAQTPTLFAVFRFIAGVGIGGVMPNTVALMAQCTTRNAIKEIPVTAMISFRPRLEENTNDNTPIFFYNESKLVLANLQKGTKIPLFLACFSLFRMSLMNKLVQLYEKLNDKTERNVLTSDIEGNLGVVNTCQ